MPLLNFIVHTTKKNGKRNTLLIKSLPYPYPTLNKNGTNLLIHAENLVPVVQNYQVQVLPNEMATYSNI